MPSLIIDARFNGPARSANGGIACGSVAAFVRGPARVRLHAPPPLDRALAVTCDEATGCVQVHDGDTPIATAEPATLEGDVPPPPSLAAAVEARRRYRGLERHIYPHCFVCGPARAPEEGGLRIFAGPVEDEVARDRELVACDWQPTADLCDDDGHLVPRFAWAALDCPSYFALSVDPARPFLLGQMTASIDPAIPGDRPLVVYAWSRGQQRRKYLAGAALADEHGRIWARAEQVWIALEPRA